MTTTPVHFATDSWFEMWGPVCDPVSQWREPLATRTEQVTCEDCFDAMGHEDECRCARCVAAEVVLPDARAEGVSGSHQPQRSGGTTSLTPNPPFTYMPAPGEVITVQVTSRHPDDPEPSWAKAINFHLPRPVVSSTPREASE